MSSFLLSQSCRQDGESCTSNMDAATKLCNMQISLHVQTQFTLSHVENVYGMCVQQHAQYFTSHSNWGM